METQTRERGMGNPQVTVRKQIRTNFPHNKGSWSLSRTNLQRNGNLEIAVTKVLLGPATGRTRTRAASPKRQDPQKQERTQKRRHPLNEYKKRKKTERKLRTKKRVRDKTPTTGSLTAKRRKWKGGQAILIPNLQRIQHMLKRLNKTRKEIRKRSTD